MENFGLIVKDIKEIKTRYHTNISSCETASERVFVDEDGNFTEELGVFGKDYQRIKDAVSFNKLEEHQIFLAQGSDRILRNRITQSLRVSQISRTIASQLDYPKLEIYAIGASALLHDIGIPPFGAYGEKVLNELCTDIGGYCINAQAIRTVTNIETISTKFLGLNLTYRTLLGAVRSFKRFNPNDFKNMKSDELITKSFLYDEDYIMLDKFLKTTDIKMRTLDTQIIDIADKIAYAAYNLNDALKEGILHVDDIVRLLVQEYHLDKSYTKPLEDIIVNARNKCSAEMKTSDNFAYDKIIRKEIVSDLIKYLMNNITLNVVDEEFTNTTYTTWDKELNFGSAGLLAQGLKVMVDNLVYHEDSNVESRRKGTKAMEKVFKVYSTKPNYLPAEFRADTVTAKYGVKGFGTKTDLQKRLAADYVSNMLESEIFEAYTNLYGSTSLQSL